MHAAHSNVVRSLRGLKKSYGSLLAVDDLSLDVFQGEVFGLLGPNGAGKTTTINMICGLLKSDAGDVMIESGGETGQQRFTDIKAPARVQKLIHAQKQALLGNARGPAGSSTDVASQLEKLEGLLERGTISPEEFDEQKRRLLDD